MKSEILKQLEPYTFLQKDKNIFFKKEIKNLTKHHYKNSKEYKKLLDSFGYKLKNEKIEKIPFLPARLFKELNLLSVNKNKISKTLLSSGTSGSIPSKIFLDNKNAHDQIIALTKIVSTILGQIRLPMLIIDQNPKLIKKSSFNARIAAIYGFSIFGKNHTYLLDKDNNINYLELKNFLKLYGNKPFFIFGFTSFIFKFLIKNSFKNRSNFNLSKGILLHGGGWKKMEKNKINNKKFKYKLMKKFNLKKIYNYYGLVEQTGSIFLECQKCSSFVTSIFSEVIIRDKHFNIVKNGDKGLIQLFSLLPTSYPGHSILTEDIGEIVNNKCECSNNGTRFLVHGRIEKSETRGCSDTT